MKVLSLFSGIGAFEKALDNIGINYELVNFCEFDKYATKSYCAVHGVDESLNLGDVTKVDEKTLPKDIDLITYGFPCQDISLAGKQKGFFDEEGNTTRSGLFFEALRIIEETKPKYAIAENVKNLTSKKFATEFEIVLDALDEAGYNNYWKVLNTKDFGIPQNRERVFIVSIRKDIDKGFEFPEGKTFENIESFLINDESSEYLVNEHFINQIKNTNYSHTYRYKEETTKLVNGTYEGFAVMDYRYDEGLRIRKNKICPTLTTRGKQSISGVPILYINNNLRFIKPIETWKLQGFTNEDFNKASKVVGENFLYKQAGNSITVTVLEHLLTKLLKGENA